jgi:hypothetical protein
MGSVERGVDCVLAIVKRELPVFDEERKGR